MTAPEEEKEPEWFRIMKERSRAADEYARKRWEEGWRPYEEEQ